MCSSKLDVKSIEQTSLHRNELKSDGQGLDFGVVSGVLGIGLDVGLGFLKDNVEFIEF